MFYAYTIIRFGSYWRFIFMLEKGLVLLEKTTLAVLTITNHGKYCGTFDAQKN